MPFYVLRLPNIKLKKPSWIQRPSSMQMFSMWLVSYFLVTGGVIYDVINEPPSLGQTADERGNVKPVAFLPYRVNGQYIMEGLTSALLFVIGGLGLILLDRTHNPTTPRGNRAMLILVGFSCFLISFLCCFIFMRMKLPYYLR